MVELPHDLVDNLRTQFQVEEYIKTRRSEETKKYVNIFIRFFNEHGTEWIRAKEIYSTLISPSIIPYTSQVTRLLSELTEIGLIERKEDPRVKGTRGSPPVYYRLPVRVPETILMSREELETELLDYKLRLSFAKEIILELGKNPDEEIEKRIREILYPE